MPGPRRLTALALSLMVAGVVAGCSPRQRAAERAPLERRPPRHVFLITVDTLRADHLGAYGYPRATSPELDRLAARGVLFERAIAQWPKTGASFASMFTGRYPQSTGLTHKAALCLPAEYLTLPELFDQLGFTTLAVVTNGVLSDELGWSAGFHRYLETRGDSTSEVPEEYRHLVNAVRLNQLALPLLEEYATPEYTARDGSGRLFVWLHYSDPHAPYILPEGVANPFLDDPYYIAQGNVELANPSGRAIGERRDLEFYVAQYDANIRVVDAHIAELREHLDRLGLLADALMVVTADHGESLGEHRSYFEHGPLPYNTTSHVPLFFVDPAALPAGLRIVAPVGMIDLYPTLLELLAPERRVDGLEGTSLLAALYGESLPAPPALAFAEAGRSPRHFRSVQDQTWKLVYARRPGQKQGAHDWELYRLSDDPGETRNLLGEDAGEPIAELDRLRAELLAWMREGPETTNSEPLSAETESALKALGYVE